MAGLGLQSHVHHWQSVRLRARLGLRAENARIVAIEVLRGSRLGHILGRAGAPRSAARRCRDG
jgi:hypothetical protein